MHAWVKRELRTILETRIGVRFVREIELSANCVQIIILLTQVLLQVVCGSDYGPLHIFYTNGRAKSMSISRCHIFGCETSVVLFHLLPQCHFARHLRSVNNECSLNNVKDMNVTPRYTPPGVKWKQWLNFLSLPPQKALAQRYLSSSFLSPLMPLAP